MKFGLKLRDKKMFADFGGIGEYIVDSLSDDFFILKDLVRNIESLQKDEIRIQKHNYKYLIVKPTIVTAFFYDEFEEEMEPEIEMGYFKTSDLIEVLNAYIEFLVKENHVLVRKLEPIFLKLEDFVEKRKDIIHSFYKHSKSAKILLNTGKEKVELNYIMKSYRISFEKDKLRLKKKQAI